MATFPLSAIVGQDELIDALLINAVSPAVGGVLVTGERGSAKSTAVRGLAALLPTVQAAVDQQFAFAPGDHSPSGLVSSGAPVEPRPAPLVELPLGSTVDRLLGSLDLAKALNGQTEFESGLLARAHNGVLYVDEVNLLPDHLVDVLLDSAATGIARIEREAVSVVHDSRFLLVGTMNIEEGELRPQLLDRFGLSVDVVGPKDPTVRAQVVSLRLEFEADPVAFAERFAADERRLAERVKAGRELLPSVRLPKRELERITRACAELNLDGMRGDIVTARAACAIAALAGELEVNSEHVHKAAMLALKHRRRKDPLDPNDPGGSDIEQALDQNEDSGQSESEGSQQPTTQQTSPAEQNNQNSSGSANSSPRPQSQAPGAEDPNQAAEAPGSGSQSDDQQTSAVTEPQNNAEQPAEAEPNQQPRRAAPAQQALLPKSALKLIANQNQTVPAGRGQRSQAGLIAIDSVPATEGANADIAVVDSLLKGSVRQNVRSGRESKLILLVVDVSGSMSARSQLGRIKGAALQLIRDAYARRDQVALVSFSAGVANVIVQPGTPLVQAAAAIQTLDSGGKTPLAAGLQQAAQVAVRFKRSDAERRIVAVVMTDGRSTDSVQQVSEASSALAAACDGVHLVDTEKGRVRIGMIDQIAAAANAQVHSLLGQLSRQPAA